MLSEAQRVRRDNHIEIKEHNSKPASGDRDSPQPGVSYSQLHSGVTPPEGSAAQKQLLDASFNAARSAALLAFKHVEAETRNPPSLHTV